MDPGATPATPTRQRRGQSVERHYANARMDAQDSTMCELDVLTVARHRTVRAEIARRRLVYGYQHGIRPLQRAYQTAIEAEVRLAEGFLPPAA